MPDDNASPNSSPPNHPRQRRPSSAHASSSSSTTSATAAAPSKQAPSSASNANAQSLARPPLRNNFDLEPNPFEQSFSVSSRTSLSSSSLSSLKAAATGSNVPDSSDGASTVKAGSPPSDKKSPSQTSNGNAHSRNNSLTGNDCETPKPILPPLASITSPSDPSYAWSFSSAGISNSLRSGPLSPAMLAGPQTHPAASSASQPSTSVAALAASAASVHPPLFGFDPSGTFRTGLTPSTGLTPLVPLVGGPVAFPPPSPNTAAFLAMMNSGGAGVSGATITPNTLSALSGVLQQSQNGSSGMGASGAPQTSVAPAQVSAPAYSVGTSSVPRYAATTTTYPLAQSHNDNNGQYANASSAATNAAANGLFLLSQAHQELTKREEAQKQSQAQANGGGQNQNNPNANGNSNSAKRGSKRKNDGGSVTTQSSSTTMNANKGTSKRTRTSSATNGGSGATNTRSSARRSSATASSNQDLDEDMDMDMDMGDDGDDSDEDDQGQHQSTKNGQPRKPETEEEKRKNFLERNRQAALKCRQRKKAWLAQLQAKVEFLQNENERLTTALVSSREEISRLSALVGSAGVGLPIAGVPVGSVSALGVGAGHPHAVGQPGSLAHHLQHPHSMQVSHLGQHHVTSQHPVSVSVSLPPGASVAQARVQASPQMMSKAAPQGSAPKPHSPQSAANEGRSSRTSFREYREGRDPREREMNGHAPQAVTVNGRGYGY